MAPSSNSENTSSLPRGRSHRLFSVFAILMATILVLSLVGTIVLDAFVDDPASGPVDQAVTDERIESLIRSTAEADDASASDRAALANYLANTGRADEAIDYYESALALEPANTVIRLDFARTLASAGLDSDAEFQFLRILEIQPDDPQATYYLGELYRYWNPPREGEAVDAFLATIEHGEGTFVAEQARDAIVSLTGLTPEEVLGTPVAEAVESG